MTKQVLVHCASDLAELHKAAPDLLYTMRGVAAYLDNLEVLHHNDPCHLLTFRHASISKHVGDVLRKTRNIRVSIRIPPIPS